MPDTEGPFGTIGVAATTLYVSDLDASLAWYDEVLGLQPMNVASDGDRYAAFLIGGGIVVLEPRSAAIEPAPPGAESTTINLVVDKDAEEVRASLLERGVVCSTVVESPNFRSFLVRDLDGNRFYVAQPVSQGAQHDVTTAAAATSET